MGYAPRPPPQLAQRNLLTIFGLGTCNNSLCTHSPPKNSSLDPSLCLINKAAKITIFWNYCIFMFLYSMQHAGKHIFEDFKNEFMSTLGPLGQECCIMQYIVRCGCMIHSWQRGFMENKFCQLLDFIESLALSGIGCSASKIILLIHRYLYNTKISVGRGYHFHCRLSLSVSQPSKFKQMLFNFIYMEKPKKCPFWGKMGKWGPPILKLYLKMLLTGTGLSAVVSIFESYHPLK